MKKLRWKNKLLDKMLGKIKMQKEKQAVQFTIYKM